MSHRITDKPRFLFPTWLIPAVYRGWRYIEAVYRGAVYRGWRYIEVGGILRLTVYQGWRYIEGGGISRLVVYRGWWYIEDGGISRLVVYREWRYIKGRGISRGGISKGGNRGAVIEVLLYFHQSPCKSGMKQQRKDSVMEL